MKAIVVLMVLLVAVNLTHGRGIEKRFDFWGIVDKVKDLTFDAAEKAGSVLNDLIAKAREALDNSEKAEQALQSLLNAANKASLKVAKAVVDAKEKFTNSEDAQAAMAQLKEAAARAQAMFDNAFAAAEEHIENSKLAQGVIEKFKQTMNEVNEILQ